MNIVLDTNVLVSGLLSPFSLCGEIVRLLAAGDLTLCLDARLFSEYREVLQRPRFNFDRGLVADLLEHVYHSGFLVAGLPLPHSLPDPDDDPFLEVALAAQAECIVTGNSRHFPARLMGGVPVLSPRGFLEQYKKRRKKTSGRRHEE
jgi:uncharacterized protein